MALAHYLRDVDEEPLSVDDDDPRVLDDAALAGHIAAGRADGRAEPSSVAASRRASGCTG